MCTNMVNSCVLYTVVFTILTTDTWVIAWYNNGNVFRTNNDLVKKNDLDVYLRSLHSFINYCDQNKDNIYVELLLGLFVTNVNLGHTIKNKGQKLPQAIQITIKDITAKSEKLMKYFWIKVKREPDILTGKYAKITTLFGNVMQWINRLRTLEKNYQISYSENELHGIYSDWSKYSKEIFNNTHQIPTPKVSDMCLVSLAKNDDNMKPKVSWCPVNKKCYSMLENGTDMGYALNHRTLLLLMARLGRGCYIFSPYKDEQMIQQFCSIGYAEVQYIAMNDFKLPDLMFEFMFLCSLEGHSQYLRRFWLEVMLNHQTRVGCFSETMSKRIYFDSREIGYSQRKVNLMVKDSECNDHTSALAAGTLANAVRFISQEYY